jgi:hypothetical protein
MGEKNIDDQNVEEIDLTALFRRAGRAFTGLLSAIGNSFIVSVLFLVKNWLPLILSVLAGVGFSYLLKVALGPVYVSELILKTNASPSSEMISYINKLHLICKDDNTQELGRALKLSDSEAGKIRDIRAYWIIDINKDDSPDYVDYKGNFKQDDTTVVRMEDRVAIRVKTKTPDDFSILRNSIINYINSDSLFQQRNRMRFRQNSEILARLNNDILMLDSLQKLKYFEESGENRSPNGGQIIFVQEHKTQLLYSDIYELYSRKQTVEVELNLFRDIVTVLSDFAIPGKPVTKTTYYGVFVIPAFFILTLLFLIIRKNRSRLGEVYSKL